LTLGASGVIIKKSAETAGSAKGRTKSRPATMLTKQQKSKQIEASQQLLEKNQTLIFTDFTGLPTSDLKTLRQLLREFDAQFKVVKKRLLKIAFRKRGIDYDPTQFAGQVGVIWLPKDLFAVAGKIYQFLKELAKAKKELKILGGWDRQTKKEITAEEFLTIAKLPAREVLLTQIAFMLTMPLRQIMVALNERAKKI